MAEFKTNPFKAALAAGRQQIGLWSSLCSPIAAEALSGSGFDWMLIDSEHAPVEVSGILPLLQAAAAGPTHPVVRVAWNDSVLIKRALDIGAQTLLVPFVQNEDEAARAVAAAKYPPTGIRGVAGSTRASGWGRVPTYITRANDEICVLVQAETPEALKNLSQIGAVDGVDGVFVGPSDLSASMGYPGNPGAPEVQEALQRAAGEIKATGKAAGILATKPEDAKRYLSWGYDFVAAGVDLSLLVAAADGLARQMSERG
ncbi:MAG: 4-hydroxy-2-oxo-heptane-1,7-dioate aldolase [Rhodobacterales bacterium]|nr:MAG: 4-hydroxy-2-oxo-heptane-1,7-dioate aldolase [Rhodobacterales bacterium]